ncbi:relaxase/mobilization nuclease domain-containing protein [Aureimonas altamirensis]|uniref:relaxase/mobilization nuclease domain-containing protein n=1 Tax=Aureimonas altamirensis TaxID=370622 RepID=UPI0020366DA7|nr:relaxase/mobilization nuclease domain-containing protein [Aureimonas altamirensis]MCM2505649.1 relaxase/mobilization nuclease domain-containing protein [Aureimonas altamirensis]
MANDAKVRALYEDFYRGFGVSAAWTPPAKMRLYRDQFPAVMQQMRQSKAATAKLARIVSKTPEVMVKVSGRTYGSDHLGEHMNYITRNGKVAAETEYGMMKGKEAVRDLHADWTDDEKIYGNQRNVRQAPLSVNMVLSMPPGSDRERFRNAVRDFVDREIRPRSEAMVAFHDDTKHPHAHVTVRGRQHNGRAFNPGKPVLERYREQFASALRERGIEAEATPRFARGRTTKAERQSMRHMRARGVTPRNTENALREALGEAQKERAGRQKGNASQNQQPRPWKQAVVDRQAGVQAVYQMAARELTRSPSRAEQGLAVATAVYAQKLERPELRHDIMKNTIHRRLDEREAAQRNLNLRPEQDRSVPQRDSERTGDRKRERP